MAPGGLLHVTVVSANLLNATDGGSDSAAEDAYAAIVCGSDQFTTNTVTNHDTRPSWNESHTFHLEEYNELETQHILVEIFAEKPKLDELLGLANDIEKLIPLELNTRFSRLESKPKAAALLSNWFWGQPDIVASIDDEVKSFLAETWKYVSPGISNKILAEARRQQQEIDDEKDEATGVAAARRAFNDVTVEKRIAKEDSDEDEDGGFSDNEYPEQELEEVTEEDERIMSIFMASDAGPQRTLADMIMERIKQKDAGISSSNAEGERNIPEIDEKIVEVYRGVGKLLSRYRSGKVPKAFKIVPNLSNWEEVLYITEPEKWSPNATFQATRLFASNLNARMAQRFYSLVLLPRLRQDINEQKRLHFALYQALKKAVYKPSAFYKGILLPLCQSRTCNLREAVIIGSVIQKVSIPALHSSVALMKIADMEYCGTNSYFMKLLVDKKYALPYRVLDAMVAHFDRFTDDERELPVIWHQCLLTFVQRYKNELTEGDKEKMKKLMRAHKHYLVTPEIQREIMNSRHRGQKEGSAPAGQYTLPRTTVVKGGTEEDIWNLPEVEIEMAEA